MPRNHTSRKRLVENRAKHCKHKAPSAESEPSLSEKVTVSVHIEIRTEALAANVNHSSNVVTSGMTSALTWSGV